MIPGAPGRSCRPQLLRDDGDSRGQPAAQFGAQVRQRAGGHGQRHPGAHPGRQRRRRADRDGAREARGAAALLHGEGADHGRGRERPPRVGLRRPGAGADALVRRLAAAQPPSALQGWKSLLETIPTHARPVSVKQHALSVVGGAPGKSRTCDLRLRRPTLYPAELRARTSADLAGRQSKAGAPGRTRTCDLRIRSPALYPTELRAHEKASYHPSVRSARSGAPPVTRRAAMAPAISAVVNSTADISE